MSLTQSKSKGSKKSLTDIAVKNAKPREKLWRMLDGDVTYRGLRLEIFPDGAKRWAFRFLFDGSDCTEGLGVYPTVTLAQAREAVVRSKQLIQKGVKPTEYKKQVRHARDVAKSNHFKAVAEQWFDWRKKKKNLDERNALKIWASLEKHVFPSLGYRPVSEIRPIECLNIIEAMQKQDIGDQAKRILQRIKGILDYAVTHQLIEHSPAISLKVDNIIRAKVKHHPALPLDAMRQFFDDVDNSNASIVSKSALRLQILTGVRTTELRGAMWSEIDFERKLWTIPTEREEVQKSGGGMKMRVAHVVPLSTQAMHIITQLKPHTGRNKFLFPSPRQPRNCLSDVALSKLMKELGYDGTVENKPHAVPHGFRTTMKMTALVSKKFLPRAVEFQLAHKNPNAIESAYERPEDYLDERVLMVQWYADEIEKVAPNLLNEVKNEK